MARDAASVQIEHDALWATIVDNVKSQQQSNRQWLDNSRQCEKSTTGCVKTASVQIEHDALWATIVDNVKSQQQAASNRQWLEMQHPYR